MREERIQIGAIPAVIYGEPSDRAYLFVHGKCGKKEEGKDFAEIICSKGWQVISPDMPGHGERQGGISLFDPWHAIPDLRETLAWARAHWSRLALRATSLGAWCSMLAWEGPAPERALLVSPVVDMARLIQDMMTWAGVTETELRERREIPTGFGETLSWRYYRYALNHPIRDWDCPTAVLYAGRDHLTERSVMEDSAARFGWALTVMENGEHWFHTPEQLAVLDRWTREQTSVTEVVAALIQDGDRFLACQRSVHKARGLLWEFVGGKVESGETRRQALIRETQEELGVTLAPGEVFLETTHRYPDLTIHMTVYRAVIRQGTPQKLEHNDIRWLTVEEAKKYPFCPADEIILERLRTICCDPL